MTNATKIVSALGILLLLPCWAAAQPVKDGGRDHARTFLVLRIAEALDLSDEKALQVSAIIRDNEGRRHDLGRQRGEVNEKLRAALGQSPPDSPALSKLIAEANEIDQQMALIPQQGFQKVQEILTVEQQARLALFRPELQQEIQRAMRRRLEGGPDRPFRRDLRREPSAE